MQRGTPLSFVRREFHIENQDKPQSGGTQDYFLHDLFAVILPRDQYLVRRTLKASRTTRRLGLFGFAGCVTLCLLAALLLIQTYRYDRALYSAAHTAPCQPADEPAPTAPRLDQVDLCRQVVQRLSDHNRQRFFLGKLLFHRSVTLEETLRQRYVEQFERDVLMPLDAHTAQRLAAGADTPPLAMLLLDRLDLLRPCLAATGCPEPMTKDGQPDYRLMLTGALPQPPQQEQVSQFQVAYEAYLRWSSGPKAPLRREQEAHTARLHGWITSAPFASQVVLWTSQHYPPVTAQEYWDVSAPTDLDKTMRVEGAYTRAGWEAGLLPLLQRADRAVPDVGQALARFRRAYTTQYFEAWQRFLEAFPHGQEAWTQPRERRLQLTARLLDARSPYNRIIDVAFANLQPLLPAAATPDTGKTQDATGTAPREMRTEAHQDDVPAWCRVLQRYAGSESRGAYVETLEQLGKQLAGSGMKTQGFALAQSGFQEGTPSEQSTHPILKAWWIIDQFQRQEAPGEPAASAVFWPLLQCPILFVWRVILEEASFAVQERWNDLLLEVKDLPPSQKHELLYGKEGRAVAFVKGPASVFLQRRGEDYTRRRLLESEMPFTEAFLLYLKQTRVGLPTPVPEVAKRRVLIRATPPSLEASGDLKSARTELILDCDTGRQVLETVDTSTELTFIWSVTSCAETILRLHLAEVSGQALEPLELRYQDLGQFLAQFNTFQRVFRLADFKVEHAAQYAPYGIKTITLRYRFAPENRQQIQKDLDDYKRYVVDTQKRLELPTTIVRIEP
jgi:type VI secretion system protein ImpL